MALSNKIVDNLSHCSFDSVFQCDQKSICLFTFMSPFCMQTEPLSFYHHILFAITLFANQTRSRFTTFGLQGFSVQFTRPFFHDSHLYFYLGFGVWVYPLTCLCSDFYATLSALSRASVHKSLKLSNPMTCVLSLGFSLRKTRE